METIQSQVVNLTDATLTTQQIQDKITQLSVTEDGVPLKNAMDDLKRALLANPAACAAMLPENIGEMVKHLIRLTGKEIEDTMAGKRKGNKKEKIDLNNLTDAQKQEIADDLF